MWATIFISVCFSIYFICLTFTGTGCYGKISDDLVDYIHTLGENIKANKLETIDVDYNRFDSTYHQGKSCIFYNKVYKKLLNFHQTKEPVQVFVIGGSMTYGHGLQDHLQQRWSVVLEKWLNLSSDAGASNANLFFNVSNHAVPAMGVAVWIYFVNKLQGADLIIADLSVNNQVLPLEKLPVYYSTLMQLLSIHLPNQPAIFAHLSFRTAYNMNDVLQRCTGVGMHHRTCCGDVHICNRWWDDSDKITPVFKQFGIPYISYRDLVWPEYDNPPPNLNMFWNGNSHPNKGVHDLIGRLVAYGLSRQLQEAAEIHRTSSKTCNKVENIYVPVPERNPYVSWMCPIPVREIIATNNESSKLYPFISQGSAKKWMYMEDAQDKFGWVLEIRKDAIRSVCESVNNNDASIVVTTKNTTITNATSNHDDSDHNKTTNSANNTYNTSNTTTNTSSTINHQNNDKNHQPHHHNISEARLLSSHTSLTTETDHPATPSGVTKSSPINPAHTVPGQSTPATTTIVSNSKPAPSIVAKTAVDHQHAGTHVAPTTTHALPSIRHINNNNHNNNNDNNSSSNGAIKGHPYVKPGAATPIHVSGPPKAAAVYHRTSAAANVSKTADPHHHAGSQATPPSHIFPSIKPPNSASKQPPYDINKTPAVDAAHSSSHAGTTHIGQIPSIIRPVLPNSTHSSSSSSSSSSRSHPIAHIPPSVHHHPPPVLHKTASAAAATSSQPLTTICGQAEDMFTLSIPIQVSAHASMLILHYLMSYTEDMGTARIWLDDFREEAILVSGHQLEHFSGVQTMRIYTKPLHLLNSSLTEILLETPHMSLPHLSSAGGKHTLHISVGGFRSEVFKWKLVGISMC